MGSRTAAVYLTSEDRIKVAVLLAGGLRPLGLLPESDPVNFLPRLRIPVLMVNGRYDPIYSVETGQEPMFRLLGTAARDRRHVLLPLGHAVLVPEARTAVVREVLDWLDRYLGRP